MTGDIRPWEAEILGLAGIAADADTMTETEVYFETPEWHALMEWLEFHGIDPKQIPAGTRILRDACNRCIRYVGFVLDGDGHRQLTDGFGVDPEYEPEYVKAAMVEQGEAPPLPYPHAIARHLTPAHQPHPPRKPAPLPDPVVPSP